MREVHVDAIASAISEMCQSAGVALTDDMLQALEKAYRDEQSPLGRHAIRILLDNARLATATGVPYCQDCGVAIVFARVGQDCHVVGGALSEAINEGFAAASRRATCAPRCSNPPWIAGTRGITRLR